MITKELLATLLWVPYCFIGGALIVGLIRRNYLNKQQQYLLILMAITAVVELVSKILWYHKINNLVIYHFYTVIEFLILSSIFQAQLSSFISSKWFNLLKFVFVLFAIINGVFLQSIFEFNSHVIVVSCSVIITFSLIYFYHLLNGVQYSALGSSWMFWLNSGVFIYCSGTLALFYLSNYLINKPIEIQRAVWAVHAGFNIIYYLAIMRALWLKQVTKPY